MKTTSFYNLYLTCILNKYNQLNEYLLSFFLSNENMKKRKIALVVLLQAIMTISNVAE